MLDSPGSLLGSAIWTHPPRSYFYPADPSSSLDQYPYSVSHSTAAIHHQLEQLGNGPRLRAYTRSSNGVLALRLDEAYTRRADLLWSLELTRSQAAAIASVTGETAQALRHQPVVGIEVEGTTPTTKTMAAEVANIAALGVRLGLLIVSEESETGIYRPFRTALDAARGRMGLT
jgi:hypothetical protein